MGKAYSVYLEDLKKKPIADVAKICFAIKILMGWKLFNDEFGWTGFGNLYFAAKTVLDQANVLENAEISANNGGG